MAWRWVFIAVVVGADAVLLGLTGRTLDAHLFASLAVFAALSPIALYYGFYRDEPELSALAGMSLQALVFGFVGTILSYLVLCFSAPLRDTDFAAIDHMLGFDWLSYAAWVSRHPTVRLLMIVAYDSMVPQLVIALLALPCIGRYRHASELLTAAMVALLFIIPFSGFFPALGPWVHYGFAVAQASWLSDVLALRDGSMQVLGEHAFEGIIVCPSFHTVLAVLFINAARWDRRALAGAVVLDGALILSVPLAGSHYLIDAIAGAVVAAAAIYTARLIEGDVGKNRNVRVGSTVSAVS